MSNVAHEVESPISAEITDEMLSQLLDGDTPTEITVEEENDDSGDIEGTGEGEAHSEEALEEVVAEIATEEAKIASYEAQDDNVEIREEPAVVASEDAPEAPAVSEAAAAESTPKPRKERTPRVTVDTLPADAFFLTMEDAERPADEVKAEVLAARPSAKKVAEKFDNVLLAVNAGKLPSVYTTIGMKALKVAREITSADMVKAMKSATKIGSTEELSDGTARAQASQMMLLLPALKIATREGSKLKLNENSTLAMAIGSLIDATPAAA